MTSYSQNSYFVNENKSNLINYLKKSTLILIMGVFISSTVVYLVEINSISEKGYKMKQIEEEINLIKEETAKLELRAISMKSMSDLQVKVADLNMVPVDKITYFESTGHVVAKK